MTWDVWFHEDFAIEFSALEPAVRREMRALVRLIADEGPHLGRPWAATLKGSRHANMKELRFAAGGGVWRVAFAFDPERKAILLVAGDKSGVSERRFYRSLIDKADHRYQQHLALRAMGQRRIH